MQFLTYFHPSISVNLMVYLFLACMDDITKTLLVILCASETILAPQIKYI